MDKISSKKNNVHQFVTVTQDCYKMWLLIKKRKYVDPNFHITVIQSDIKADGKSMHDNHFYTHLILKELSN